MSNKDKFPFPDIEYLGGYPNLAKGKFKMEFVKETLHLYNSKSAIYLDFSQFTGIHFETEDEMKKRSFDQQININDSYTISDANEKLLTIDYYYQKKTMMILCFTSAHIYDQFIFLQSQIPITDYQKIFVEDEGRRIQEYYRIAKQCLEETKYNYEDAIKLFNKRVIKTPKENLDNYIYLLIQYPEIDINRIVRDRKKASELFYKDQSTYNCFGVTIYKDKIQLYPNSIEDSLGDVCYLALKNSDNSSDIIMYIYTIRTGFIMTFSKDQVKLANNFYNAVFSRVSKIKDPELFEGSHCPNQIEDLFYLKGHPCIQDSYILRVEFTMNYFVIVTPVYIVNIPYTKIKDIHLVEGGSYRIKRQKVKVTYDKLLNIYFVNEQNIPFRILITGQNTYKAYLALQQMLDHSKQNHPTEDRKTNAKLITVICEYCNGINTVEVGKDNKCAYCGAPISTTPKNKQSTSQNNSNKSIPVEQLTQLKHLLDSGIITQEEFDAKKRQLLGL